LPSLYSARRLRALGSGVEDRARYQPPVIAVAGHRRCTVLWDQRCHAHAEHESIRTRNLDRLLEVVDAWRQDQVLAPVQPRIDRRARVRWAGDEELVDRNGAPRCLA